MSSSDSPLIRLEGVTKVFLTDEVETHALSGVHMEIKKGEYISIAGPSGCGKSTLLSILGLLDTPSNGSYTLKESEVANLSFPERARIRNREIGFIFQSFKLASLTVSKLSPINRNFSHFLYYIPKSFINSKILLSSINSAS